MSVSVQLSGFIRYYFNDNLRATDAAAKLEINYSVNNSLQLNATYENAYIRLTLKT